VYTEPELLELEHEEYTVVTLQQMRGHEKHISAELQSGSESKLRELEEVQ